MRQSGVGKQGRDETKIKIKRVHVHLCVGATSPEPEKPIENEVLLVTFTIDPFMVVKLSSESSRL